MVKGLELRIGYSFFWVTCIIYLILNSGHIAWSQVIFVDNLISVSSDENDGTKDKPLKSIGKAVQKAKCGDTIYVKDGTYRESVLLPDGTEDACISLLAWPGCKPIIKGSEVISGPWTPIKVKIDRRKVEAKVKTVASSGSAPNMLQAWFDYAKDRVSSEANLEDVHAAEPNGEQDEKIPFLGVYVARLQNYTQMVFVDGVPLEQVGYFQHYGPKNFVMVNGESVNDLYPGTFYYSNNEKKLYVWLKDGSNPENHTVEISVRDNGIIVKSNCVVDGFFVQHFQVSSNDNGGYGIRGNGDNIIIRNCKSFFNDFSGMALQGKDSLIINCELAYNGNNGFTSNIGENMMLEKNVTHHNNFRRYKPGWHDGGLKITCWTDSKIIGHHSYAERLGLWLDINVLNLLVAECIIEDSDVGIYYEISRWGIIVNNIIKNCGRGIWSYSSDVLIANNIIDQCSEGITVSGDWRYGCAGNTQQGTASEECLVAVRNNMVVNNIIIDSVGSFIGISEETEHCGNNFSDYNVFVWTLPIVHGATNHIKFMGGWDRYYGRLAIWQKERNYDQHSYIADETLTRKYNYNNGRDFIAFDEARTFGDPLFVNRQCADYTLQSDSPLINKGINIPVALKSEYFNGAIAWEKTFIKEPNIQKSFYAGDVELEKHYRAQPNPTPMLMFDPEQSASATPGLVRKWSDFGEYPVFRKVGK